MTKQEFYERINTEITVGCALPFSVPEKAVDNIIDTAYSWFVRNWDDAVEETYLSIPKEMWANDEEFKATRKITLPKCVYAVNSVSKDAVSKRRTGGYSDVSFEKHLYSNWGLSGGGVGLGDITQSDALLGFVVSASWADLSYHLLNFPISFDFNRHTKKLFLKGSVESNPDFLLQCYVAIPQESIFELDLFYDYCVGYSKMQLSNIMGTFGMSLPGGAEINFDRYYDQGKDQMDSVKEEVKSMRGGADFFLTTNSL